MLGRVLPQQWRVPKLRRRQERPRRLNHRLGLPILPCWHVQPFRVRVLPALLRGDLLNCHGRFGVGGVQSLPLWHLLRDRRGGLHGLRLRALDGSGEKTFYIKNICSHEAAYEETGNQAVSYTTGVPAMIGAAMLVRGDWQGNGVFNIEQMDPDPFMDMLNAHGLPWTVEEMAGPVNF